MKNIAMQIATLRTQLRDLERQRDDEKFPWMLVWSPRGKTRLAVVANSRSRKYDGVAKRFKTEVAARREHMRRAQQRFKRVQKEQREIEIAVEDAQQEFTDAEHAYWAAVRAKESTS